MLLQGRITGSGIAFFTSVITLNATSLDVMHKNKSLTTRRFCSPGLWGEVVCSGLPYQILRRFTQLRDVCSAAVTSYVSFKAQRLAKRQPAILIRYQHGISTDWQWKVLPYTGTNILHFCPKTCALRVSKLWGDELIVTCSVLAMQTRCWYTCKYSLVNREILKKNEF
jgi:hypothetical protein